MHLRAILLLPALFLTPCLNAQSEDVSPECVEPLKTPLPAEAAAIAAPTAWPGCDSYKSYSGIGRKVDYEAARQCAWRERLAQQAGLEPRYTVLASIFGGSAMLTVLYANGEGVERNIPLALRFACEIPLSDSALIHISQLSETDTRNTKKFRYCDEVGNTFDLSDLDFCAVCDLEIAGQRHIDILNTFMRRWTASDRRAFRAVQQSNEQYVEAHGRGEVYQGGTIRNLRTNSVEEHMRVKFLEAVQSFEHGHLPRGSKSDFQTADADLNATYKKLLALAAAQDFKSDDGLIKPGGIRDAQRAWLRYRDAWVSFAKVHYPSTGSDAWLTLLTSNRVWSLRQTLCEVAWDDPACKPR